MAAIVKARVQETSATTGTGAITLGGAVAGFRTFASQCSVADTFDYMIEAVDANGTPTGQWEIGTGTYSGTNTLTRTTPSDGSASTPVSFAGANLRCSIVHPTVVQATLTGTETLTNKTLTSPALTTPALGTPASGNLSSCTADGTNSVGFLGIPQNSKSAAYTTVLADAGKHLLHPSADTTARIFTIDSNANVAYPINTAITFVNQNSGGVITIAITSDTMRLAGAGTTGSRTLAANGIATALKLTSTEWIIAGTGLT